jgi:hypothetical protein
VLLQTLNCSDYCESSLEQKFGDLLTNLYSREKMHLKILQLKALLVSVPRIFTFM